MQLRSPLSAPRRAPKLWGGRWLSTFAGLLALAVPGLAHAASAFDLDQVAQKARRRAERPYREPARVPSWLLDLDYDTWRRIRFRPERALWSEREGVLFQVQLFHPGLYYDRTVALHTVDADGVHPVGFSPDAFDYGDTGIGSRVSQDLGYAGFRIHHPIKSESYYDEVAVFLGASYFRAVGREQGFGISARGLAIDTALPSGEEFPWFREFWIVRPSPGARDIRLYALLDSPSLTGAYRFAIVPGEETVVAVDMRLFLRREVQKLGIAPLTSMFFYGENSARRPIDYRPEVHDSDGLLVAHAGGEWLWRPLQNPERLQVSAFGTETPRGFGLVQRDRDLAQYQDLESRFERRPSLWVEPEGSWGAGHVELVEIPTDSEKHDNIVAYWVPREAPAPGEELRYAYETRWYGESGKRPPRGRAVATRWDEGSHEEAVRFVVDFAGRELAGLPDDAVLRGVVSARSGEEEAELLEQHVVRHPGTEGWRLVFELRPRNDRPLHLRAFLQRGDDALTETWSYTWSR